MRVQCVLIILSFWLGGVVFSQTLNELSQSNDGYKKDVKALVIGISDYQNIRSLNYAHRDAEEFAKFLQDNPFWNVKEGNIFLFTNENARQGEILMGLQWLMETTTEEQEVIFFFSGHGDVENVDGLDQGFLLAHDAPKNNYAMGGTIAVSMLDSAFTELIRRNVKINIIVDACKSGQLAGGMTGTGHTNETLAAKWTSQTRILSAQPNQLSLEDEKWGDGRGVFSYFLIRGMSGYANADNDELIRLNEIENYLGENLAKQTLGAQQPIVDGPNKWTKNFSVKDTSQMAFYEDDEVESELTNLVASTKAGEDQVAENCKALYGTTREKIKALNRDAFSGIKADYAALMECSGNQYASLRYEYMRQLINQINSLVNNSLTGKHLISANDVQFGILLIEELLHISEDHQFIGDTHFRKLKFYFEVQQHLLESIAKPDPDKEARFLNELEQIIDSTEPTETYLVYLMGILEARTGKTDESIKSLKQAIAMSPTYLNAKYQLGRTYVRKANETSDRIWLDSAKNAYYSVLDLDSIYREFNCIGCFYEDLSLVILETQDPALANLELKKLLERTDDHHERIQLYLKIIDIETLLGGGINPSQLSWYRKMKSELHEDEFEDCMVAIYADVKILKPGLSLRKVDDLLNEMQTLAESDQLQQILEEYNADPQKQAKLPSNKLFVKYFKPRTIIKNYNKDKLNVYSIKTKELM